MTSFARWTKGALLSAALLAVVGLVVTGCDPVTVAAITSAAGDSGGSGSTPPAVSTGTPPQVVFANKSTLKSSRGRSGQIGVNFQMADAEKDIASLLVEYSINGGAGESFKRATVVHPTTNNNPGQPALGANVAPGNSQVTDLDTVVDIADAQAILTYWDSTTDIGLKVESNVVLRITAYDVGGKGNTEVSEVFSVDNTGGLAALVGPKVSWPKDGPNGENQFSGGGWTSVHPVYFTLRDPNARPLSVSFEYSSSSSRQSDPTGGGWTACTPASDGKQVATANLRSSSGVFGIIHPNANLGAGEDTGFRWDVSTDIPDVDSAVKLRLTPSVTGSPEIVGTAIESQMFSVLQKVTPPDVNNTRPIVNIIDIGGDTAYQGKTFSGTINFGLTLKDANGDNVTLTPTYSLDGNNWQTATGVTSSLAGVTTLPANTNVSHTMVWDSTQDITDVQPMVLFRVTISDAGGTGNTATTAVFSVNNSGGANPGTCDTAFVNANATFTLNTPAPVSAAPATQVTTSPTFDFSISDPEGENANLLFVFLDASGVDTNYYQATTHPLSPEQPTCIDTTTSPHQWRWDAQTDITAAFPGADLVNTGKQVWFYVFHNDPNWTSPSAAQPTNAFLLSTPGPYLLLVKDDNKAPTITIDSPAAGTPVSPPYTIQFTVNDPDGDNINVQFQYFNGTSWATMTESATSATPITQPMASGQYTFEWDAATDLGSPLPASAFIQLIPTDVKGKQGLPSTRMNGNDDVGGPGAGAADPNDNYTFQQNERPVLTLDSPNSPVTYPDPNNPWFSGDVNITFTVYDKESDPVDVLFQYWDNTAFKPMTIKSVAPAEGSINGNSVIGLTPGPTPGKQYVAVWDTVTDIPGDLNVFVNLTPSDQGGAGTAAQSGEQVRVKNDASTNPPPGGGGTTPPTVNNPNPWKARDQGNGTYGTAQAGTTGSQNRGIAAADLNFDGKDDLVIADQGTSEVVVKLSNGDGTFTDGGRYVVGFNGSQANTAAYHVAAADFNKDGAVDIAAIAAASFDVTILYNLGNGAFQAGDNYLTMTEAGYNSGSYTPFDMELGDANGDEWPDVYVLNTTQSHSYQEVVGVLTNTGNGLLNAAVMSDPGLAWQSAIGVGDWNGDNLDDCIVGQLPSASDKSVQPMISDGSGSMALYGPRLSLTDLPNGAGGQGSCSGLQFLFDPFGCLFAQIGAGSDQMGVFDFASGDFDGDGDEDVAAPMAPGQPNGKDGAVGIFLNNGGTGFHRTKDKSWMTPVGANPYGIVSSFNKAGGRDTWGRAPDLNNDGKPDIVASANLGKLVSVALNNGSGSSTKGFNRTDYGVNFECWYVTAGDFDYDGRWDIATTERVASTAAGGPAFAVVMGQ